jgi:GrpB-like predicted nucleotidyltransferase (UPF0157 family)
MRLVFVEGVSGVGKTTLALKLNDALKGMGHSVKCYLEGDADNPIDFLWTKHMPKEVTLAEYARMYTKAWKDFARRANGQSDYIIFDGSLLHHPINDMMRNFNAPIARICKHIDALAQAVGSLRPLIIYLSCGNVAEGLAKANETRNQPPRTPKQIQFWQKRGENDLAVLQRLRLPVSYDIFDITGENWDSHFNDIITRITETDDQRRARIYPIVLQPHNPEWARWYAEEKACLERFIGTENIERINHYGSTAVPGLTAKPTVDILLEVTEGFDLNDLADLLPEGEYFLQWRDMPRDPLILYKGYGPTGFGERIFHIHVRPAGDWDELYFRDYLIANPAAAAEYAALKERLKREYTHDRDGYTDAKGEFIQTITKRARNERAVGNV